MMGISLRQLKDLFDINKSNSHQEPPILVCRAEIVLSSMSARPTFNWIKEINSPLDAMLTLLWLGWDDRVLPGVDNEQRAAKR